MLCRVKQNGVRTTDGKLCLARYPNLTKGMMMSIINQVWLGDITYIRIRSGFVHLTAILDAHSSPESSLRPSCYWLCHLPQAGYQPDPKGSARGDWRLQAWPWCDSSLRPGVQYAAGEHIDELTSHGFMVSMARTGSSYENGMMESFFKTLKHEEVYLCQYGTREDVMDRLPHFVEEVYNRKRLHSALGYLPPNEFEGLLSIDLGRQLPRKTLRTLSVQS